MIYYTIGALFTKDFSFVMLILKTKPDWQKGKYNLPGGKVEDGEDYAACVSREFKEETDLDISPFDWNLIGHIEGQDYKCGFLTAVYNPTVHGKWAQMTEEMVYWHKVEKIHELKVISNLYWLIPFAMNSWNQGSRDKLIFGNFKYQ